MTPEIRKLYKDAEEKNVAATELLKSGKSEDEARATALLEDAEALQNRAQLLERAERVNRAGVEGLKEEEAEEREALRKRSEAADAAKDATGARAVPKTVDGTLEADAEPEPATAEEHREATEIRSLFKGLLAEMRDRETPEARMRRTAFRKALVHGYAGLTGEERRHVRLTSQITFTGSRDDTEARAMGLGSAGSLAILVPEEVQREVRLARLAFGGWRDARLRATYLSTSTGRSIPIPTINDTSNQGSYRGEHETIAVATDVVAKPNSLGAYLLRSGVFQVGYELMQDEDFGLESLLITLGTIRNERRRQTAWTTANGQSLPKGVMEGITSGKTAANQTSFEPTDWFEFFESVDAAYHPGAVVMLSNNALTKLKVMTGGIGQGLWQPGLAAGQPAEIDGHPYVVNFAMDSVAAGNKPAVFGDFSWMYIREVVPTVVVRYAEKYAPDVGFEIIDRDDSRLVDPGVTPIKCLTMAA